MKRIFEFKYQSNSNFKSANKIKFLNFKLIIKMSQRAKRPAHNPYLFPNKPETGGVDPNESKNLPRSEIKIADKAFLTNQRQFQRSPQNNGMIRSSLFPTNKSQRGHSEMSKIAFKVRGGLIQQSQTPELKYIKKHVEPQTLPQDDERRQTRPMYQNQNLSAANLSSYKKLLLEQGIQIHPKQTKMMLNNHSVQQLVPKEDLEIEGILARAKQIQDDIEAVTLSQGHIAKMDQKRDTLIKNLQSNQKEPQSNLDKEFLQIIESNLKEQLAQKIAQEISNNIQVKYDKQDLQHESMSGQPEHFDMTAHQITPGKSQRNKIPGSSGKKSLTYIRKDTFSSKQKTLGGTNNQMLPQSLKKTKTARDSKNPHLWEYNNHKKMTSNLDRQRLSNNPKVSNSPQNYNINSRLEVPQKFIQQQDSSRQQKKLKSNRSQLSSDYEDTNSLQVRYRNGPMASHQASTDQNNDFSSQQNSTSRFEKQSSRNVSYRQPSAITKHQEKQQPSLLQSKSMVQFGVQSNLDKFSSQNQKRRSPKTSIEPQPFEYYKSTKIRGEQPNMDDSKDDDPLMDLRKSAPVPFGQPNFQVNPANQYNSNASVVQRINHPETGPESHLAERMKQISVYDLYKLSASNDNVNIDSLIKQQLVSEVPSVAPGFNSSPQRFQNNFLRNAQQAAQQSVDNIQNNHIQSMIKETSEEHMRSQSFGNSLDLSKKRQQSVQEEIDTRQLSTDLPKEYGGQHQSHSPDPKQNPLLEPLSTSYDKFKKRLENRRSQLSQQKSDKSLERKKETEQDDQNIFAYRDSKPTKSPQLSARKGNYLDSINKRYGSSEKRERKSMIPKTSPRARVITDSQMTFGDDKNASEKPRLSKSNSYLNRPTMAPMRYSVPFNDQNKLSNDFDVYGKNDLAISNIEIMTTEQQLNLEKKDTMATAKFQPTDKSTQIQSIMNNSVQKESTTDKEPFKIEEQHSNEIIQFEAQRSSEISESNIFYKRKLSSPNPSTRISKLQEKYSPQREYKGDETDVKMSPGITDTINSNFNDDGPAPQTPDPLKRRNRSERSKEKSSARDARRATSEENTAGIQSKQNLQQSKARDFQDHIQNILSASRSSQKRDNSHDIIVSHPDNPVRVRERLSQSNERIGISTSQPREKTQFQQLIDRQIEKSQDNDEKSQKNYFLNEQERQSMENTFKAIKSHGSKNDIKGDFERDHQTQLVYLQQNINDIKKSQSFKQKTSKSPIDRLLSPPNLFDKQQSLQDNRNRPKSSGYSRVSNVGISNLPQNRVKYTKQKLTPDFVDKPVIVEEAEIPRQWEESQGSNQLRNTLQDLRSFNDKNTTSKKDKLSKSVLSNPKRQPYQPLYKQPYKERVSPLVNSSLKSKNSIVQKYSKPINSKAVAYKHTFIGHQKDSLLNQGFDKDESDQQNNSAIKVPNKVGQRNILSSSMVSAPAVEMLNRSNSLHTIQMFNQPMQPPNTVDTNRKFQGQKSSSKKQQDSHIRQLRLNLQQSLNSINMISLSEVEYIRKPQRYMIFSGKLFKILFDLISQTQFYAHEAMVSQSLNKQRGIQSKLQKIDKDLNRDLQESDDNSPVGNQDTQFDQDLGSLQRIQQKFFAQSDQELSRLDHQLKSDSAKGKEKDQSALFDNSVTNEWNLNLKPFLNQNTLSFQNNIRDITKQIKVLVETSEKSEVNIKQIMQFFDKILFIINSNQNLSNMCLKVGKNGSLFCKLYESVKLASFYTIEKCQKALARLSEEQPYFVGDQEGLENTVLEGYTKIEEERQGVSEEIELIQSSVQAQDPNVEQESSPQYSNQYLNQGHYKSKKQNITPSSNYENLSHQIEKEIANMKSQIQNQPEKKQKVFEYKQPSVFESRYTMEQLFHQEATPATFQINLIPMDKLTHSSQQSSHPSRQSTDRPLNIDIFTHQQEEVKSIEYQEIVNQQQFINNEQKQQVLSVGDYLQDNNINSSQGAPDTQGVHTRQTSYVNVEPKVISIYGSHNLSAQQNENSQNHEISKSNSETIQQTVNADPFIEQNENVDTDNNEDSVHSENIIQPNSDKEEQPQQKSHKPAIQSVEVCINNDSKSAVKLGQAYQSMIEVLQEEMVLQAQLNHERSIQQAREEHNNSLNTSQGAIIKQRQGQSNKITTKRSNISNLKPKKKAASKPSYGLYHPNTGIPVYSVDPDFDLVDIQDFKIHPIKIYSRVQDSVQDRLEERFQEKNPDKDQITTESPYNRERDQVRQRTDLGRGQKQPPSHMQRTALAQNSSFHGLSNSSAMEDQNAIDAMSQSLNNIGNTSNPYKAMIKMENNTNNKEDS